MSNLKQGKASWQIIALLMLAGEAVFLLPFVLARIFRPTFLATLDLDNTQLGNCFSVYGLVALISYLFGGWFADRFSPGKLMGIALFLTAAGGLVLANQPSYNQLLLLFGYWGFTTIFLFWAAMIKATRIWGGEKRQGKAFGFLEAGRGLVASSIGMMSAFLFAALLPLSTVVLADEKQYAFQVVVLFASLFVLLVGVLVFFFLKTPNLEHLKEEKKVAVTNGYLKGMQTPSVWLLMLVILSAYVGYKSTDFISQYAKEIMLFNEMDSAKIGALFLYLRPVVAISIGLIADQSNAIRWIIFGFVFMILGGGIMATGVIGGSFVWLFILSTFALGLGVYATRTLYFALLKEARIPLGLTGVTVSLVSVVGYLPDIFMGPLTGYFLDNFKGEVGFRYVFSLLTIFALVGLIASLAFKKVNLKRG